MDRKIRTIITISGVIIGIATIVFLTSLGYGVEKSTTSQIASADALYIFDTAIDESDLMLVDDKAVSDISNISGVETTEPGVKLAGKISTGLVKTDVIIKGYSEKYLRLAGLNLIKGRLLTDEDGQKVMISSAALELMNINASSFDQTQLYVEGNVDQTLSPAKEDNDSISLGKRSIVGVIDDEDSAYIVFPFEELKTAMSITGYNELKVKVKKIEEIDEVRSAVESMGYPTEYLGDTIAQINAIFAIFRYVIGGFGLIAMLVAVLGMFNTLTVSLLERTREIGVLKANNSGKRDIFMIFLTEALLISVLGAIFGVGSGLLLGEVANYWFNFYAAQSGSITLDLFFTPTTFMLEILVGVVFVGFFTGVYPSMRATKIKILDALKYE